MRCRRRCTLCVSNNHCALVLQSLSNSFLNITNLNTKRNDLEFDCLSVDYSAKVIKEMKKMAIKKERRI